jgi:hypothetical protein
LASMKKIPKNSVFKRKQIRLTGTTCSLEWIFE